jgi:hypothetical protein
MGMKIMTVMLVGLGLAGCCGQPGVFGKVHDSLAMVQSYYGPLVEQEWGRQDKVRQAVVAADTTLLLAGELQRQWCPDAGQAEQLALQAKEAHRLAQEAGVAAPGVVASAAE